MKDKTCEERIERALERELEIISHLYKVYTGEAEEDDEATVDSLREYGYGFDYVPVGTYTDVDEPFWVWTTSGGGPSSEFRFFSMGRIPGPYRMSSVQPPYRIEYWFKDWFDGAHRVLHGEDRRLIIEAVWDYFAEVGEVESTLINCRDVI